MKNKTKLIPVCIAAMAFYAPTVIAAEVKAALPPTQGTTAAAVPAKAALPVTSNSSERAVPFHGVISATDEKSKTFTIAGKESSRVFKITEKTVLTKGGMPATMKDVTVNEEVRGSYSKAADGTLEGRTVKLGPKTAAEKSAAKKKKKTAKTEGVASPDTVPSGKPQG
jgi:hypothetical protein